MPNWSPEDLEEIMKRKAMKDANPQLQVGRITQLTQSPAPVPVFKKHKYNAQRTNGYASKKEAKYAEELGLRQKAGEVWFWLRQVPFDLPGGSRYFLDFMVFRESASGTHVEFIECKGMDLALGRLKRKQVCEIYGIHITVV